MNRSIISKQNYQVFAGASWPSYEDFISGVEISNKKINNEINKMLENEHKKQINRQIHFLLRFLILEAVPATLGIFLFFYLGGTWQKFIIISIVFYLLNYFYKFTVHRWLSHNQIKIKKWAQVFLLWVTTLFATRPSSWVKMHLSHHRFSDTEYDPYPPSIGLLRNLIWHTQPFHPSLHKFKFRNKLVVFFDRYHYHFYFANIIIFAIIDIDIVLLSLFYTRLLVMLVDGWGNYFLHDGNKTQQPINYSWWLEIFRPGEGAFHGDHHKFPEKFDGSKGKVVDFIIFCKIFTEDINKRDKK